MSAQATSLVDYYRQNRFNPVPIDLRTPEALAAHTAKRRNLYEGHLGIPLGLLSGQRVLEFGCNSGENAVVLARAGADLTLVEPNEQAHERLRALFETFGLSKRLTGLVGCGIDEFPEDQTYNIVLAEGFLFTLPNKAEMAAKLCRLLAPGGIGVISFNCRFGGLVEMHKRLALRRACEIAGIEFRSEASLALAEDLFGQAFGRIKASRPFAAWWKDLLVNPFYADRYLWSYREILPVIEAAGAELLSTSPRWFAGEIFRWYKDVPDPGQRHLAALNAWRQLFGSVLTGKAPSGGQPSAAASEQLVDLVAGLMLGISDYTEGQRGLDAVALPLDLRDWLCQGREPHLQGLGQCLAAVHEALGADSLQAFQSALAASGLADLWGSAYHYASFTRTKEHP